MFGDQATELPLTEWTADVLESALVDAQSTIDQARAEQLRLLVEIDRRQTPTRDGTRTLGDWIATRLDETPETAAALATTSRTITGEVREALESGEVGYARAAELSRLAAAGVSDPVAVGWSYDIAGIRRRVAAQRRITPTDEADAFENRYLAFQPTLDMSVMNLWGQLPGDQGTFVYDAITATADELDHETSTAAQRRADALTILTTNAAGAEASADGGSNRTTVYVDAEAATETSGQTGITLDGGYRIGPRMLDAILCDSILEVRVRMPDGTISPAGPATRTIPPAMRRDVYFRDHGHCVIDACDSRSRLEIHHIVPWAETQDHDLDNLALLCWYHHMVAIHRHGLSIDPTSPPHRRRLVHPPPT